MPSIGDFWPVKEVTKFFFSTSNTSYLIIMMISVVLCKINEKINNLSIFHDHVVWIWLCNWPAKLSWNRNKNSSLQMLCLEYIVWYGQFVTNWCDFIEIPFYSTQYSSWLMVKSLVIWVIWVPWQSKQNGAAVDVSAEIVSYSYFYWKKYDCNWVTKLRSRYYCNMSCIRPRLIRCHWSFDPWWVKISGHWEQLGPCGSTSHFVNNRHSKVKTRGASCIGGFGQTDGRRKFELGIPQSRGAPYIRGASYIRDKTVLKNDVLRVYDALKLLVSSLFYFLTILLHYRILVWY